MMLLGNTSNMNFPNTPTTVLTERLMRSIRSLLPEDVSVRNRIFGLIYDELNKSDIIIGINRPENMPITSNITLVKGQSGSVGKNQLSEFKANDFGNYVRKKP